MNQFQSALIFIASTLTLAANASETKFVAGDKTLETQICVAAVQNNILKYRQSVRKISNFQPLPRHNHKIIANRLTCNDQNIASFARSFGAEDTARYISRYLIRRVDVSRDLAISRSDEDSLNQKEPETIIVTAN